MSRFNKFVPDEVIELYVKGEPFDSLAKQIGISRPTIRKAVTAAGLKSRPACAPRKFDHDKIMKLHQKGKRIIEIAEKLKIKYNTVWGIISNHASSVS